MSLSKKEVRRMIREEITRALDEVQALEIAKWNAEDGPWKYVDSGLRDVLGRRVWVEAGSDLLNGSPKVLEALVGAGVPVAGRGPQLTAEGDGVDFGTQAGDLGSDVVHDSSSRVSAQVLDTPVAVEETLGDAPDSASSSGGSGALHRPASVADEFDRIADT